MQTETTRLKPKTFFQALQATILSDLTIIGSFDSGWQLMARYRDDLRPNGHEFARMTEAKNAYIRRFRTLDTATRFAIANGYSQMRVIHTEEMPT